MPDFSAQESTLGYLYQAQYALWLLLDGPEEREVVVETLDDIVFEQNASPEQLLQTKFHAVPATLTNASAELWKTVRVWSTQIKNGSVNVPPVTFTLITTAVAPSGSIAQQLRPGPDRNCDAALSGLLEVTRTSKSQSLANAFEAFGALTAAQQRNLVSAVLVLDESADVMEVQSKIHERIRVVVDRKNRESLFERLQGWWLGVVIGQLRSNRPTPITGFEVYDKLRSIAEQFRPNALPIDYLDARPDALDPHSDDRVFVDQLRAIDVRATRIEKAILDYYRAYQQRSRWAREELLIGDEVETYERRLIDEWERFAAVFLDELQKHPNEIELKKVGREIFKWMEQSADIRIRPDVREPYIMRGSYHLLADSEPLPRVWWHPKFVERLEKLLGIGASAAP